MSKVDAQRAMKAARHARTPEPTAPPVRRAPAAAAAPATTAAPASAPGAAAPESSGPDPAGASTQPAAAMCGHRNMAGKECRRPAGHPEKSHRYT